MLAFIGYVLVAIMVINLFGELLASDHAPKEPPSLPPIDSGELLRYLVALGAFAWMVWYVQ